MLRKRRVLILDSHFRCVAFIGDEGRVNASGSLCLIATAESASYSTRKLLIAASYHIETPLLAQPPLRLTINSKALTPFSFTFSLFYLLKILNNMEIDLVKSLNEILQVKALEEMLRAKGLTTIVDPDGDVMLELSNITLRVSSKVLSLASPVFKAMLGPNFSEGIPTETGLRTIKLPDDNSALVHYLCCILHHRYNYLEVDVDISLFQGLTLLTDKYDCVKAVQHWGINCLRKLLKEGKCHNFHLGDHPQYSRLLVPAVVFDDPEIFQEVTRLMILEFSKFYHVGYWIGDRPQALSDAPNLNITEAVQALLPADLMGENFMTT